MSEVRLVQDRHFIAPLTDEEMRELKVRVAQSGLKQKQWISRAIREQLKEGKQ
ncbi:hypothetical protein LCGC14_1816320 [marine sediment metagenome]|uniref:Ribbon-helix-helix protein CopG domain-containing protein n=1 Tax=marine sediment metagenome TaxID=412755 RepID=A0A0F9GKD8_9ZZZZ